MRCLVKLVFLNLDDDGAIRLQSHFDLLVLKETPDPFRHFQIVILVVLQWFQKTLEYSSAILGSATPSAIHVVEDDILNAGVAGTLFE